MCVDVFFVSFIFLKVVGCIEPRFYYITSTSNQASIVQKLKLPKNGGSNIAFRSWVFGGLTYWKAIPIRCCSRVWIVDRIDYEKRLPGVV